MPALEDLPMPLASEIGFTEQYHDKSIVNDFEKQEFELVDRSDVVDYYTETIDDYQTWSRQGYMHFGLWRPWLNPLNRRAMLESMNDAVFDALDLRNDVAADIGDLGCGVAAVSEYGSRRFPNHRWHAFSICPRQVAYANTRINGDQVKVSCADYCDLPLPDQSLDGAYFLESLCYADHLQSALCESSRVLKPGGRLVVVDGMMRNRPEQTPAYARRLAAATEKNWALARFHAVPDFEPAARHAGFEIEAKREMGWNVAPSVAHSPVLIAMHSLKLIAQGKWSRWKRRHMIGCALGVLLGLLRRQFGYYLFSLRKT